MASKPRGAASPPVVGKAAGAAADAAAGSYAFLHLALILHSELLEGYSTSIQL